MYGAEQWPGRLRNWEEKAAAAAGGEAARAPGQAEAVDAEAAGFKRSSRPAPYLKHFKIELLHVENFPRQAFYRQPALAKALVRWCLEIIMQGTFSC